MGQFIGGWASDRFGRRPTLYSVLLWIYLVRHRLFPCERLPLTRRRLQGVVLEVIATTWQGWLGSKMVIGLGTGLSKT